MKRYYVVMISLVVLMAVLSVASAFCMEPVAKGYLHRISYAPINTDGKEVEIVIVSMEPFEVAVTMDASGGESKNHEGRFYAYTPPDLKIPSYGYSVLNEARIKVMLGIDDNEPRMLSFNVFVWAVNVSLTAFYADSTAGKIALPVSVIPMYD